MPRAVVRATSTEDVQAVPRGGRAHTVSPWWPEARFRPPAAPPASTAASSSAPNGCGRSTSTPRTAPQWCNPACWNSEVKKAAAEYGLWYPPGPRLCRDLLDRGERSDQCRWTVLREVRGHQRHVLGMQVVLADGTAVRLGGPRLKDVAGLSLTKLFVGSEGILGVITELSTSADPSAASGVDGGRGVRLGGGRRRRRRGDHGQVRPAMLELMDHATINAVEDHRRMGLDRSAATAAGAVGCTGAAAEEIAHIVEACEKSGATEVYATDDAEEGAALTAARRLVGLALMQLGTFYLEDVTVPIPDLPALVAGIKHIAEDCDVLICVIAHAGDGNTHPVVVKKNIYKRRKL